MKEKISSLIKFIAVIAAFALIFYGIGHAYQMYFGLHKVAKAVGSLIVAAVGLGVGFVGLFVGNLVNR